VVVGLIGRRLDWLAPQLSGKDFVLGPQFTVADGYLFTVLSWSGHVGIDLAKWPPLAQYCARIAERPQVKEARRAEGLVN